MQHLEASGAVRHIYVVRQLRVKEEARWAPEPAWMKQVSCRCWEPNPKFSSL